MNKRKLYIVIASQEYKNANHQNLWMELSKLTPQPIVVVNIPADYIVSTIRGKRYRIHEARKDVVSIKDNLKVVRPIFLLRPELLPSFCYKYLRNAFWNTIKKACPDYLQREVKIISYSAKWVNILHGSEKEYRIAYYLYDEVRFYAHNNQINKSAYEEDMNACKNSDVIYTMTKMLADSRRDLNQNIKVIGNGSVFDYNDIQPKIKFQRSIAFIGNFRNWIDTELLTSLIEKRPNVLFAFAGPIEDDMKGYLNKLMDNFDNTVYLGKVSKDRMSMLYRMFNGVIIPYKKNPFIQATRPIKIVESVLSGTPVVTIPMDGYDENSFIRFATDTETFVEQIDYILNNPIDRASLEYINFVKGNTWRCKASEIIESLD